MNQIHQQISHLAQPSSLLARRSRRCYSLRLISPRMVRCDCTRSRRRPLRPSPSLACMLKGSERSSNLRPTSSGLLALEHLLSSRMRLPWMTMRSCLFQGSSRSSCANCRSFSVRRERTEPELELLLQLGRVLLEQLERPSAIGTDQLCTSIIWELYLRIQIKYHFLWPTNLPSHPLPRPIHHRPATAGGTMRDC